MLFCDHRGTLHRALYRLMIQVSKYLPCAASLRGLKTDILLWGWDEAAT
jgi:hypothetical protein